MLTFLKMPIFYPHATCLGVILRWSREPAQDSIHCSPLFVFWWPRLILIPLYITRCLLCCFPLESWILVEFILYPVIHSICQECSGGDTYFQSPVVLVILVPTCFDFFPTVPKLDIFVLQIFSILKKKKRSLTSVFLAVFLRFILQIPCSIIPSLR